MNRPIRAVFIIFILMIAPFANATEWKSLRGTFAMTAENYLDPGEKEATDSHLRIQLTGQGAKDLFMSMKVTAKKDACTGAMQRRVGAMECRHYAPSSRYECAFSINVMQQKIESGVSC